VSALARLAVTGLATYRATKLVIDDEVTRELREWVTDRLMKVDTAAARKVLYLIQCPWCVSIWTAGGLLLLRRRHPDAYELLAGVLAASAVTGILSERVA
jgi:hypothetical protein